MLKRLELVGFKSFADKTVFDFSAGVTAIVGPNGSGKSNVVDAVKWVLGEQSAKSLRGGEMADVIFNGSTSRKSLGLAEVTMTFDNGQGALITSLPEVRITRRVYRDGEGEYLINGQPCRLKDIKDLFLGSGAGASAYCIIEQGRVDALLLASTVDRRTIFEEAAGISRFKAKKIESLRRLERVEQNLQRLRDILTEVENQLRSVRLHAAKAQRYQEYSQRLRDLRVALGLRDDRALSAQLGGVVGILEQLRGAAAEAAALSASCIDDARRHEDDLARLETAVRAQEQRLAQTRADLAGHEAVLAAERSQAIDLEANTARLRLQVADATRRFAALTAARTAAESEWQDMEQQCQAQRRQVQSLSEGLEGLIADLVQLTRNMETDKGDYLEQMRRVAHLENEATHTGAHLEQLRRERERLTHKHAQAAEHLSKLDLELDTLLRADADLQGRLGTKRQTLANRTADLARNRDAIEAQTSKLADMRARRSGLSSRIDVLHGLERSHEGLGAGSKEILAILNDVTHPWHQAGFAENVIGLVGDLLSAGRADAPLLDLALGPVAQHFVIRDVGCMLTALDTLGQPLSGRVSFIAAQAASAPATPAPDDAALLGNVRRADAHVLCERPDLSQLPKQLLGRTLVVPDIATARSLAATYPGHRFVTRTGELLDADGTLTVGTYHAESGILSRKSELRELRQQAALLADDIVNAETDLALLQDREATLESERHALQQEIEVLAEQSSDLRERVAKHRERREGLHEEVSLNRTELSGLEQDIGQLERSWSESNARAETADLDAKALQLHIAQAERTSRTQEQERQSAQASLSEAKIALAKIEERLTSLRIRHEQLAGDLLERGQERDELVRRLSDGLARQAASERTQLATSAALAECCRAQEDGERERERLAEERDLCRQELRLLQEQMQSIQGAWKTQQENLHTRELEASDLRHRRDTLVQRLREDYQIELENEQEQDTDAPRVSEGYADAEVEIDELRKKLARLGSVDLDSLQELADLELRDGALRVQFNDLTSAQRSLHEIIATINQDSRRLFTETFALIRANFQDLFRKLFAGGQADVLLENETEVLESGIEIVARPPGKELRSISLMSGGEKTLTAVALLLAIFRSKPSPFCLLDEVDAALDEANTARLAHVLREFLDRSQFIIVTHSKRTMASADVLYGITMQESGISKRVAVRFEDWPDEEAHRQAA